MRNLLSKLLLLLTLVSIFGSCTRKSEVEYLRIPPSMMLYEGGGDLDSLIRNSKYTAITFLKDGCGACVPNLKLWDEIIAANPLIKPVIIAEVYGRKRFAALFSTYGINYPFLFDNEQKIQKLNDSVWMNEVILIDSTYKILAKKFPFSQKWVKKFYLNLK